MLSSSLFLHWFRFSLGGYQHPTPHGHGQLGSATLTPVQTTHPGCVQVCDVNIRHQCNVQATRMMIKDGEVRKQCCHPNFPGSCSYHHGILLPYCRSGRARGDGSNTFQHRPLPIRVRVTSSD